jgi:hypothetical protein
MENKTPYYWKQIKVGNVYGSPRDKVFGIPIKCDSVVQLRLLNGIPDILHGESHISHDDQIKINKGRAIALILWNKRVHYVPLDSNSDLFIIPKLTWHCLVNIDNEPIDYQNWILSHQVAVPKDYYPVPIKHKFDIDTAKDAFYSNQILIKNI